MGGAQRTVAMGSPGADPWELLAPDASRRLLQAAADAFAERGYHATTTRDIAGRVGLSPAGVYIHFPSKAALLAQISRSGHEAALQLVEDNLAAQPDPVARVRAVVAAFAAWHAEFHRVARVVQHELPALPEADRAYVVDLRQQIERRVEEQLRAGVAAGVMEVSDTRGVTRALLSLAVDVARWYVPGGRATPRSIGELYADLAARMIGARQ